MASISNYDRPRVIQSPDASTPPTFEESIESISRLIEGVIRKMTLKRSEPCMLLKEASLQLLSCEKGEENIEQAIEILSSIQHKNVGIEEIIKCLEDLKSPKELQEPLSIEFVSECIEEVRECIEEVRKSIENEWADDLGTTCTLLRLSLQKLDLSLTEGAEAIEQAIEMLKNIRREGVDLSEIIARLEDIESLMALPPHTSVLNQKIWLDYQEGALPPYPVDFKEFIEGDCTIWPDKKRYETHIVFPVFSEVSLEEKSPVPLNLNTLRQLDGHAHIAYVDDEIDKKMGSKEKFCWAAMTYDIIPESGGQSALFLEGQLPLPEGYQIPTAFEAVLGLLWHYRRTNKNGFASDPENILTCCREKTDGDPITVGAFDRQGLCITTLSGSEGNDVGVAVLRKFPIQMPAEH